MYTAESLRSKTVKDLSRLAAKQGVAGWQSMRKDDLVRALLRAAKAKAKRAAVKQPQRATASQRNGKRPAIKSHSRAADRDPGVVARKLEPACRPARRKSPRVIARIQQAKADRERQKSLATAETRVPSNGSNGNLKRQGKAAARLKKDRIVLLVRDAYWLQAIWELGRPSVERAQAAMAEQWHTARPVLRLIEADGGATTSTAERVVRDIEIHGGVNTWYVDVPGTTRSYRVDIGYLSRGGKYYSLARSNTVTTPRPDNGDIASENWSDIVEDCEKIYALSGGYADDSGNSEVQRLFEERLGRPMGSPSGARFGAGADKMLNRNREFQFEVDAEMIVYGTTKPNAHVTLAGAPVKLRPDGTFTARLAMPDRRQVLPVVASSADGVEQRTVVLAIERNTKVMEPMIREAHE